MRLSEQIEKQLHLKNVEPKSFLQDLLSKEGLGRSHGQFEDFEERGQRVAYLIVAPRTGEVSEPTKADIMLHFEPLDDEISAIFNEILGVDLTQGHGRALSDAEVQKIKGAFPIFWKISDYYEDAYLSREEAELLLQECASMDRIASAPKAIRGLDKLSRIAYWASSKNYGIFFSAP